MKKVLSLISALVTAAVMTGCCCCRQLKEEIDTARAARVQWLKTADKSAQDAASFIRTADLAHPTADMAVKAALCADFDALKTIKKNGFTQWDDPFIILAAGKTPFAATVKLIHLWGGDLNAKYSDGAAVIHCAAHHGNLEVVRYLGRQGVEVNTPDNEGMTPLHWAASEDRLDVVRFLLIEGADAKLRTAKGKLPADLCKTQEVRQLLQTQR